MAVQVDIPGVGNVIAKNAAEDSTLQEILKALKGRGGTGGVDPAVVLVVLAAEPVD